MFRKIKDYEYYGEISDSGEVKSYARRKNRKPSLNASGFHYITINSKKELIKNLVAKTWIRDFNLKYEHVVFIDGDTTNHHYSNLRIEPINRFKLSQEAAKEIRELYHKGMRMQGLADKYEVSKSMISDIINSKKYK